MSAATNPADVAEAFRDTLIQQWQAREPHTATPWLALQRRAEADTLGAMTLPGRKHEMWKYTSLLPLYQSAPQASNDALNAQGIELPEALAPTRLVFVDGHYAEALSHGDGAVAFSHTDAQAREALSRALGRQIAADRHWFAHWNACNLHEGALVQVSASTPQDVEIVHIHRGDRPGAQSHARVLVLLDDNSEARIIERFVDLAPGTVTGVSEVVLGADARLHYSRVALPTHSEHRLFGSVHAHLARGAQCALRTTAIGTALHRQDIHCVFSGEGAHADIDGVMFSDARNQLDTRLEVEHASAHCTSNETWRGLAAGQGAVSFNGRIHIHEDAQKTAAVLSNKNLLLSKRAQINTKPELEIYADDVTCAHGATIGQLDPDQLYYLQSRGIPRADALGMLSFGFINELLQSEPNEALRERLEATLRKRFLEVTA